MADIGSGSASLLNSFFDELLDIQSTRYARVAAYSIIWYDYLIMFDKEVVLIWPSKWSLAKILFLINRYYVLSVNVFNYYVFFSPAITDSVSVRYFVWEGSSGLITFFLAQAILQLRIYVLYSMNKKIVAFVITLYLGLTAVAAWFIWEDLASFTATAVPIPGGKFCVPAANHLFSRSYAFWIPLLLFDSLLGVLALIRGIQEFKSARSIFGRRLSLVEILIRDSVFYFFVIAISYLVSLFLWRFAPSGLQEAPIGFSLAISSVLANRILFNLRDAAQDTAPVFHSQVEDF